MIKRNKWSKYKVKWVKKQRSSMKKGGFHLKHVACIPEHIEGRRGKRPQLVYVFIKKRPRRRFSFNEFIFIIIWWKISY